MSQQPVIDISATASRLRRGGLAILCAFLAATAVAGPSVYPVGVTRYDPARAYNCDVLFSAGDNKTYLIDMNGNVLHQWNVSGMPAKMLDPALVDGAKGEIGARLMGVPPGGGAGGRGMVPGQRGMPSDEAVEYVDWAGKTLWQWGKQAPGGAAQQHHDWDLLANGDTLILANRVGPLKLFGSRSMSDDVIYEVDKAGRIVWTWAAYDHLAEFGFTGERLEALKSMAVTDYLHMNDMEVLGPNRWDKAGDQRFAPDNFLISSRNSNFIAIISRKTGKVVWRLGPFAPVKQPYDEEAYTKTPPFPVDRFSGQHDANMIPEGLPGAGNILIFDNEGEGGYPPLAMPMIAGSRALEIDPVKREVVWQYAGTKATFFSPFISSVQRLPNGNTLIDEGIDGRFFQVTPAGEIVWEYVSPFRGSPGAPPPAMPGPGTPSTPAQSRSGPMPLMRASNGVYRIQAVPYDWVPLPGPHSQVPVKPPAGAD